MREFSAGRIIAVCQRETAVRIGGNQIRKSPETVGQRKSLAVDDEAAAQIPEICIAARFKDELAAATAIIGGERQSSGAFDGDRRPDVDELDGVERRRCVLDHASGFSTPMEIAPAPVFTVTSDDASIPSSSSTFKLAFLALGVQIPPE